MLDFSKNTLLEKGLSVTALTHFMDCPSRFLYQSILKLPQPPAASAEKGNVMHDAFSRVWKSEDRSAHAIEASILHSLESFRVKSLLPSFETESIVRELSESAPLVAKALAPHFS